MHPNLRWELQTAFQKEMNTLTLEPLLNSKQTPGKIYSGQSNVQITDTMISQFWGSLTILRSQFARFPTAALHVDSDINLTICIVCYWCWAVVFCTSYNVMRKSRETRRDRERTMQKKELIRLSSQKVEAASSEFRTEYFRVKALFGLWMQTVLHTAAVAYMKWWRGGKSRIGIKVHSPSR